MSQTQRLIAEVIASVLKQNRSGYVHVQDIMNVAKDYGLNITQDDKVFTIGERK